MLLIDVLFALIFALLIGGLFSLVFRTTGPWSVFWVFLLIIFLGSWAGGLWIAPFGPVLWEVTWIPFLFAALIIALLLAAVPPMESYESRSVREIEPGVEEETIRPTAFGLFFWTLLIILAVVIILGYLTPPEPVVALHATLPATA